MKTINFKQFLMYDNLDHTSTFEVDLREEVADGLYKTSNGIAALDLALKVHRSDGPIELTEDEFRILDAFAMNGTARFIDSLRDNIFDPEQTKSK